MLIMIKSVHVWLGLENKNDVGEDILEVGIAWDMTIIYCTLSVVNVTYEWKCYEAAT